MLIWSLVLTISAAKVDESNPLLHELSSELKIFSSSHAHSNIIDFRVFEDQVHILADPITGSWTYELYEKIRKVSKRIHISVISNSSLGVVWPMEKIDIVLKSPTNNADLKSDSKISSGYPAHPKRGDIEHYRRVMSFSEPHCGGDLENISTLTAGKCLWIWHEKVKSVYMYNHASYDMHISLYSNQDCSHRKPISYAWQSGFTSACYRLASGESLWWDWPGYNAP